MNHVTREVVYVSHFPTLPRGPSQNPGQNVSNITVTHPPRAHRRIMTRWAAAVCEKTQNGRDRPGCATIRRQSHGSQSGLAGDARPLRSSGGEISQNVTCAPSPALRSVSQLLTTPPPHRQSEYLSCIRRLLHQHNAAHDGNTADKREKRARI